MGAIRGELKYRLGLHLLPCFARHCTSPKVLSGARQEFTGRHKILLDRRQLLARAGVSLWVLFRLLPQEPTASFPGEASRPLPCHLGRSKPPDKGDVARAATGGSGVPSCSVQGRGVSLGQFSLVPPRGPGASQQPLEGGLLVVSSHFRGEGRRPQLWGRLEPALWGRLEPAPRGPHRSFRGAPRPVPLGFSFTPCGFLHPLCVFVVV